jgi:hypothetical protein
MIGFCFIFLLQQQKNPKYSLSLLPHLKLHLPHHLLPRTQLLFLPQRRGKLSNPMQQSSSSSLVTANVPMKFPKQAMFPWSSRKMNSYSLIEMFRDVPKNRTSENLFHEVPKNRTSENLFHEVPKN